MSNRCWLDETTIRWIHQRADNAVLDFPLTWNNQVGQQDLLHGVLLLVTKKVIGVLNHVVASGAISDKDSANSRKVGCFEIVPTIPSLASDELLTHGELLTQDRNKRLVVFASFGYIFHI